MRRKRNYRDMADASEGGFSIAGEFGWAMILALAGAILLLMFGTTSLILFINFLTKPVMSGSVPIWAIFVVGLAFVIYLRRR